MSLPKAMLQLRECRAPDRLMLDPPPEDSLSPETTINNDDHCCRCRCPHRTRRIIPIVISVPVLRARTVEKRLVRPQSNNSAVELEKVTFTFCIFVCAFIDEKLLKNESHLVISCMLKDNENKISSYVMINDEITRYAF